MAHILIVDDLVEERKLLQMLLEHNGYRVTTAGDGVEALAAARHDRPDAVVSDVLMPNMDGFVLCHTWMQDAELKAIAFSTMVDIAEKEFKIPIRKKLNTKP
jgi:CheY-like chemotaxis protein